MSISAKKKKVKRKAQVSKDYCVACGACTYACPIGAIKVVEGVFAEVDQDKCVGCSKCANVCPASTIEMIIKDEVN